MHQHRFFIDQPLSANSSIDLTADAARYIQQVLRLKVGQHINVFNGRGGEFDAVITGARKRLVSIDIGEHCAKEIESPLDIHLGQGMARSDRMDYAIQKAVELGAQQLTPIGTHRSVTKLQTERVGRRLKHWQSVATHAAEQCGRTRIPKINPPTGLEHWTKTVEADLKLCMDPTAQRSLKDIPLTGNRIALLIGPEGGLTDDELASAKSAGFIGTHFGPRILRTETATVVGLGAIQFAWGDLT
jgi:16S rRNA (uracil1498-N3)-methyltransferase